MTPRSRARRIVLAYSGGLNSSVAIPWLSETADSAVDVVTITLDREKRLNALLHLTEKILEALSAAPVAGKT